MSTHPDPAPVLQRVYGDAAEHYARVNGDRSAITPHFEALTARLPTGATVLDLGCAVGWETAHLARLGHRAIGLDLARGLLRYAAEHHPARYVEGDSRALPFADASFDGVWACASLLHLRKADLPQALAEVARVLRPGAPFTGSVQTGTGEQDVRSLGTGEVIFYAYYEPAEWREHLEAVGFTVAALDVVQARPGTVNAGATGWVTSLATR